jgi:hypothetical protein
MHNLVNVLAGTCLLRVRCLKFEHIVGMVLMLIKQLEMSCSSRDGINMSYTGPTIIINAIKLQGED